jgi:hypothetical protein
MVRWYAMNDNLTETRKSRQSDQVRLVRSYLTRTHSGAVDLVELGWTRLVWFAQGNQAIALSHTPTQIVGPEPGSRHSPATVSANRQ